MNLLKFLLSAKRKTKLLSASHPECACDPMLLSEDLSKLSLIPHQLGDCIVLHGRCLEPSKCKTTLQG